MALATNIWSARRQKTAEARGRLSGRKQEKTDMKNPILLVLALLSTSLVRAAESEAPSPYKVSEFTFTRPARFEWVPVTSSMRQAQLRIKGAATTNQDPAEIVFFYFGAGNGGSTADN